MTESKEFIRAKLVSRTNADCSESVCKNNRWHYFLRFENSMGIDWLHTQLREINRDLDVKLELYKIRPSGVSDFELEVREVNRRSGIDENQNSLQDFAN